MKNFEEIDGQKGIYQQQLQKSFVENVSMWIIFTVIILHNKSYWTKHCHISKLHRWKWKLKNEDYVGTPRRVPCFYRGDGSTGFLQQVCTTMIRRPGGPIFRSH
jgi:hypothetical protein